MPLCFILPSLLVLTSVKFVIPSFPGDHDRTISICGGCDQTERCWWIEASLYRPQRHQQVRSCSQFPSSSPGHQWLSSVPCMDELLFIVKLLSSSYTASTKYVWAKCVLLFVLLVLLGSCISRWMSVNSWLGWGNWCNVAHASWKTACMATLSLERGDKVTDWCHWGSNGWFDTFVLIERFSLCDIFCSNSMTNGITALALFLV